MSSFVKIPNSVFEQRLTPSELMSYCYLLSRTNPFHVATLKMATIAEGLGCSRSTAVTAIGGLVGKGLVKSQARYVDGAQTANRYYVARLEGKWFKLDRSIFSMALNKSDFSVYLYILRCSNGSGNAFPSASRISSFTGISEPRIRKAVKELAKRCLLHKQRQKRVCGCYGCNRFKVFTQELRKRLMAFYRKVKRRPLMFSIRAAVSFCAYVFRAVWLAIAGRLAGLLRRWLGRRFFWRI